MPDTPTPGSPEAVEQGCTCPVEDNARGAGWMGLGDYWVNGDCPLHGFDALARLGQEMDGYD